MEDLYDFYSIFQIYYFSDSFRLNFYLNNNNKKYEETKMKSFDLQIFFKFH